jgi:hypothetical protein
LDIGSASPPGEVLHFSEDPSITRFVPHVAVTAREPEAYVWALEAEQATSYRSPKASTLEFSGIRLGNAVGGDGPAVCHHPDGPF